MAGPRTILVVVVSVLGVLWGCAPGAGALSACDLPGCACDAFGKVACACTDPYQELVVQSKGTYPMLESATSLEIQNCSRVRILPDTLLDLHQLKTVKFHSIGSFSLPDSSLHWDSKKNYKPDMENGIKILIYNSTVDEISSYAVKGSIYEFVIESSTVNLIKPFALSTITDIDNIRLINSTVKQIESQAFKKFSLNKIEIKHCTFEELPSRMFADLKMSGDFLFISNKVQRIKSSFCMLSGTDNLKIENCEIGEIDGDAFKIATTGSVSLKNNVIKKLKTKSFYGISVPEDITKYKGELDFNFWKNTVSSMEVGALDIEKRSFTLILKDLRVEENCDCRLWYFHLDKSIGESTFCNLDQSDTPKYISVEIYKTNNCYEKKLSAGLLSLIVVTCFVILMTFMVATFLAVRNCRKNNATMQVSNNPNNLVIPDGRTYKETQLFMVVEKAELLTTDL